MAAKTFRVAVGMDAMDADFGALAETDQTAANRTDGWTSAKIAAGYSSNFDGATKLASGTFSLNSSSPKPASLITTSAANAFTTSAALSGVFANAAWTFTFALRCATASAQRGRMLCRIYKSANADGTGATELTSAALVGTTVAAALSTSADQTSVVTWNPGATVTLNNEFLFFALAWEITTAGGANGADVLIRTGQAAAGSRLVTPNFVANHYGQIDRWAMFIAGVLGRKRTFGKVAQALAFDATTDSIVTPAAVTHYGATSLAVTFGKETAGVQSPGGPPPVYSALVKEKAISYWRLGTGLTAHDEMGVVSDATATGGVSVAGLITGDPDAAISFDGVDDQITFANNPAHALTVGSLEIWLKTPNAGSSHRAMLVKEVAFGMFLYDNQLVTYDWGGFGNQFTGVFLNDDIRHHVVMTFQSGVVGGTQFYVDGVAVGSPLTITVTDQNRGVTVAHNANVQWFTGVLDDPAIYGVILTPTEIAEHYVAGTTGTAPEPVTHYGSTSLAVTTNVATAGQRKTFGTVALPVAFSKTVAAQRKTFGVVARPATFSATTTGQRKTFSTVAMPVTFAKAVAAQRKTFGVVARPITFTKDVAGIGFTGAQTYFGSIALPVVFTKAVAARKHTFGQTYFPITFTKAVSGIAIAGPQTYFGIAARPITFLALVNGSVEAEPEVLNWHGRGVLV